MPIRKEPEIKIVSDGTSQGTFVYAGGKLLESVIDVHWRINSGPGGELAQAQIVFDHVALEALAEFPPEENGT